MSTGKSERHYEFEDAIDAAEARGYARAISDLEAPNSGLCSCDPDGTNPPTNPRTGAAIDHHCDCRAVAAVAGLLGGLYSKTIHAGQCDHGTEYDDPA